MKKLLPKIEKCFCCGDKNPIGLNLDYYFENNKVYTEFETDKLYGFSEHTMHLGILLGVLFEGMAWLPSYVLQYPMVLVRYEVRTLGNIPVLGQKVFFEAEPVSINRWKSEILGYVKDEDGNICINAKAILTMRDPKEPNLNEHYK